LFSLFTYFLRFIKAVIDLSQAPLTFTEQMLTVLLKQSQQYNACLSIIGVLH